MRVFEEQFFKVSIWGILPVFLAFIVFLCTVLIKCMKKEVLSPIEEFCDKKKFHKTEKIYSKVVYLSDIYFLVCVTLAIIPFVILFNARYDSYIYEMIKKIEVTYPKNQITILRMYSVYKANNIFYQYNGLIN